MTPSELKAQILEAHPESKFFCRENMRFAGDTMRNFGVRAATIMTHYDEAGRYTSQPQEVQVWELYRKQPTPEAGSGRWYFCQKTFKRRHAV